MKLNTIEEALEDLKNNKVVIVVDDENRENEGDFIFPAENITPEVVNFMATHGRGLICAPLTSKRCKKLNLDPMVQNNTEPMKTAFTISVDLKGHGVTSGISASDRSKTIKALVDLKTKPSFFYNFISGEISCSYEGFEATQFPECKKIPLSEREKQRLSLIHI